jgi:hypothetical protein
VSFVMRALALSAAVAVGPGCVGELVGTRGDDECPADNAAPDTPTVTAPAAGAPAVTEGELVLGASAFVDPDGDAAAESEWEIWRVVDGTPTEKVWSATLPGDATDATLADGEFAIGAGLAEDAAYQARVRHRAAAGCEAWSAWSTPRGFRTDDGSAYLFVQDEIRDYYLEFSEETRAALDAQASPPGCVPFERESYPATLTFEGRTYAIGLKTKGGCGSARPVGGKPSWKINLEWDDPEVAGCPEEQRLHGLKHLTLNNMVQDQSAIHEQLAYGLYGELGVVAPRVAYARVHVNGEYTGLYLNVETIDRSLLGRWFDSNDGMLYEGTYWCDLIPGSLPASDDEQDDTAQCLGREFSGGACSTPDPGADPTTYAPLRGLVMGMDAVAAGDFHAHAQEVWDFDEVLSMWAVDAIMNHWDGFFFQIMNNYRVYRDPSTDRWSIIPSGLDQTFVTYQDRSAFAPQNVVGRRCLEEPACKAAFVARLDEALAVFEDGRLAARAAALRDQIADEVAADPRKEYGVETWAGAVQATLDFIGARPAVVRADVAANAP